MYWIREALGGLLDSFRGPRPAASVPFFYIRRRRWSRVGAVLRAGWGEVIGVCSLDTFSIPSGKTWAILEILMPLPLVIAQATGKKGSKGSKKTSKGTKKPIRG